MNVRVASRVAVALITCAGLAAPVFAQTAPTKPAPSKTTPTKPAKSDPASQPAPQPEATPTNRGAPVRGDYVKRGKSRDTLLKIGVRIMGMSSVKPDTNNRPGLPGKPDGKPKNPGTPAPTDEVPSVPLDRKARTELDLESVSMMFPLVRSTSGSDLLGNVVDWPEVAGGTMGYRGRLQVAGALADSQPDVLTGYAAGVQIAKWIYVRKPDDRNIRDIELTLEVPVRTYAVEFDEKAASLVPWPRVWPEEAASALKPQTYIERGLTPEGELRDYDPKIIEQTLQAWLDEEGIKDIKSTPLVQVAKVLTGRVWRTVQPSGDGQVSQRNTGRFMGLELQAPSVTLDRGRGSEHDMVILLVAMLKQAGIPARAVIGLESQADGDRFLDDRGGSKGLRAWVEFCVYDEARNSINWVPIDIYRMRRSAPRPPKLTTTWKWFGTTETTMELVPFALQYQPPTDVATYPIAGFWGWFVTPKAPADVEMALSFHATDIPRRQGEDLKPSDNKKPEKKKDKFGD
ncbi:MAG TPA: transglutaminase domain-containing protein [Phycisphaerales bacterium]|nr:transglutaminase domain-containing protein [Phycisphaerales bacterium]